MAEGFRGSTSKQLQEVILRTDNGIEDTVITSVQRYLRFDGQDEHAGTELIVTARPIQISESRAGGLFLEVTLKLVD